MVAAISLLNIPLATRALLRQFLDQLLTRFVFRFLELAICSTPK
jgi:hypothetical protein